MTALPAWPIDVPLAPQVDSLQVAQTTDPPLVSEMNSGTLRRRRKFTTRIAKLQFNLFLTNAQAASLQSFYENDLGDGAARFTAALPWRGVLATRNCAFAQPLALVPLGPEHQRAGVALLVENL